MSAKFSPTDDREILKLLHNVPVFFTLDNEALKSIIEISTEATFAPNKTIIQEGGYGDSLHLILMGKVEVRKGGKPIASLGLGQFFGEMAFLDDLSKKRSADVVAIEETKCLVIPAWSTTVMSSQVICDTCGEVLESRRELELHIKDHDGEFTSPRRVELYHP